MTDQQNAALEPCPFCKKSRPALDWIRRDGEKCWFAECLSCGSRGPFSQPVGDFEGTNSQKINQAADQAALFWNTRPAPAGAEAVREALELMEDHGKLIHSLAEDVENGRQKNLRSIALMLLEWGMRLEKVAKEALDGRPLTLPGYWTALAKAPSTGEVPRLKRFHEKADGGMFEAEDGYWVRFNDLATPQPAPAAAEDALREAALKLKHWLALAPGGLTMEQNELVNKLVNKLVEQAALRAKPEASTEKGGA